MQFFVFVQFFIIILHPTLIHYHNSIKLNIVYNTLPAICSAEWFFFYCKVKWSSINMNILQGSVDFCIILILPLQYISTAQWCCSNLCASCIVSMWFKQSSPSLQAGGTCSALTAFSSELLTATGSRLVVWCVCWPWLMLLLISY